MADGDYVDVKALAAKAEATLNKLAKWRGVFASWQLGTRGNDDPESSAVRDHREVTMMLRVEVSALVALLVKKGVFSQVEFTEQMIEEAEALDKMYEDKFPGFSSTEHGIAIHPATAGETLRKFPP